MTTKTKYKAKEKKRFGGSILKTMFHVQIIEVTKVSNVSKIIREKGK
jgi:hypothetical protein